MPFQRKPPGAVCVEITVCQNQVHVAPAQDMNQQAVLRTAEALGIQNVYVVRTPIEQKKKLMNDSAKKQIE